MRNVYIFAYDQLMDILRAHPGANQAWSHLLRRWDFCCPQCGKPTWRLYVPAESREDAMLKIIQSPTGLCSSCMHLYERGIS